MRTSLATLWSAALLAAGAQAIILTRSSKPAVVGLDVQRREITDPIAHVARKPRKHRKRDPINQQLDNLDTLYFANITLGTPGQKLRLHLDTGSSDLWTNAQNSKLCVKRPDLCQDSGVYNGDVSSTYQLVNDQFNISYVDNSGASGDYAKDTLFVGNTKIEGVQFGIGYDSGSPEGVFGIGFAENEAIVRNNGGDPYDNVPQRMVKDGLIKSNAFSLWLNDLEASTGSILFGGVNTAKYHGSLQTMPMQLSKGSDVPIEFVITLTDMSVTQGGKKQNIVTNQAYPVLLDSGSSITYLPDPIFKTIGQAAQVQYSNDLGSYLVDCSLGGKDSTFDFYFSGVKISVPFTEVVIDPGTSDGSQISIDGQNPACLFGFTNAGDQPNVLGDTFLRSAYIVYDLQNREISLAQTNFNATKDDIQEVGTGKGSVPNASRVQNPVVASATQSGAFYGGPGATGAGFTITSGPHKNNAPDANQVPMGAVGLLAGVGALFAI